ncbi:MAG: esterase family protein [Ruminococcus sp.]|nr:esterase family protein [Ruminococcus sp.]
MERSSGLIEQMQPDEIIKERDGVTYPKFEKFCYYSNTAERETPVNVLLPKDHSEDKKYPVLYILHGYWGNEDWMTTDDVHLSTMLTNLIADGEAEQMIVVCPYIFTSKDKPYCTAMDTENTLAYDNFINDMMTDLMPYIEENFPAAKGRDNTAITGFSMGGREALYIGFTYPDRFGYIGSVCAAPGVVKGTGQPYDLEEEAFCFTDNAPHLLLMSAAVNDNVVEQNPMIYHRILTENGTRHLWHAMSETGHDAGSVTPHLYNFMRMIFKGR